MSVPAYNRQESSIQFLDNMRHLRKAVNLLLETNFGIKPRSYEIKLVEKIYDLSPQDKEIFEGLSQKYGMETYEVDKYPEWLINDIRHEMRGLVHNININIELANNIVIRDEESYFERRKYWELAIGYCQALKDSNNEILECFDAKPSRLEEVYKLIDYEIKLLRGVRDYDKKKYKKIEAKEVSGKLAIQLNSNQNSQDTNNIIESSTDKKAVTPIVLK